MQKFKRKSLYLALAAAMSTVGIVNTASAVYVNGNGLGQVLIYPYYSTRNDMNTYVSVVNTTSSAKAVKVRFTEGKNSREVLDFNLYLSKHDVWTGAIVGTANGARLITYDKSCTAPAFGQEVDANGVTRGTQDFVNFAYTGAYAHGVTDAGADGESTSLDRTREGYFEIIEMGVFDTSESGLGYEYAVTHIAGVPANCAVVQNSGVLTTMNAHVINNTIPNALAGPQGGLAGSASLINVAAGSDYGFDPVALASFQEGGNIWDVPGNITPDLRAGTDRSVIFNGTTALENSFNTDSSRAVSAVLMHNNVINEYVLDTATLSATDWIVTLPTKRYFVPVHDPLDLVNTDTPIRPFSKKFWTNGACEPVSLQYWNREEATVNVVGFSPLPPSGTTSLCWETNVVTFRGSHLLGSNLEVNVPITNSYQNGWLNMSLNNDTSGAGSGSHNLESYDTNQAPGSTTFAGLPTVGFMVQDFVNGNVGGVLSNYGGNFIHKYETFITRVQ